MRFGYWLPVFGGWLRNVDDEGMDASWRYVSRLARRSEEIGFDLTLIAELMLNDIKGPEAPSLDAWTTAARSNSRMRQATGSGVPQSPARSPRLDTEESSRHTREYSCVLAIPE